MRNRFLILVLLVSTITLSAAPLLVPEVKQYNSNGTTFDFSSERIYIQHQGSKSALDTENTAQVTSGDITKKCGVPVSIGTAPAKSGVLSITLKGAVTKKIDPEAYQISISDKGIEISAWDATGLFWGTRTAIQIIAQGLNGEMITLENAEIYDRPEFKVRGLMLDCGRHFFQVETIKFWLKYMADYKMNYFHWHLTEWNGFRFDSEVFQGLGTEGASYSKAQIKDIVDFAALYHITVVPELDIPGHANAMIAYDPMLNFQKGKLNTSYWAFNGKLTRDWHLDPTSDYTRDFIKKLIDEMCEVFPGPYFHIGTDEYIHNPTKMAMVKELRDYKKAKGFEEYPDIWIDFINYCNSVVKSNSKTTKLWNWWEVSSSWMKTRYSIEVDRDVEYDVWLGESADRLGGFGVNMINCSGGATYITPGANSQPDLDYLYGRWTPYEFEDGKQIADEYKSQVLGAKINVWADDTEHQPDSFFSALMYQPVVALGSVCWQGKGGDVKQFVKSFEAVK